LKTAVSKLFVLHMQSTNNKGSAQTFRERLANWLFRRGRSQQLELLEVQDNTEEEIMPSLEVGSLN
jgi:hypothetical protein